MKWIKKIVNFAFILVFSFSLMNCVPARPVHEPPPRPRREARPSKPGPNYFWVSGHHVRRHGRWVWVSGHWTKKRHGKVWVKGRWAKRGGRWVWVPGHWK